MLYNKIYFLVTNSIMSLENEIILFSNIPLYMNGHYGIMALFSKLNHEITSTEISDYRDWIKSNRKNYRLLEIVRENKENYTFLYIGNEPENDTPYTIVEKYCNYTNIPREVIEEI